MQGRPEVWPSPGQILDVVPPYHILVLRNVKYTGTSKLPAQTFTTFKGLRQKLYLK